MEILLQTYVKYQTIIVIVIANNYALKLNTLRFFGSDYIKRVLRELIL